MRPLGARPAGDHADTVCRYRRDGVLSDLAALRTAANIVDQSFIPVLLVIHECWNAPVQALSLPQSRSRKWDYLSVTHNIIYGRTRDVLLIVLLSCSSMLAFMTVAELPSTYICANVYAFRTVIPVLQIAGTCLDTFIIISAGHLVFRGHENTSVPSSKSVASLGWALLVSNS